MRAVEQENPDLRDILPKTYNRFENTTLAELLKIMNSIPMDIEGDAFGKIHEYFLGHFARAEGQKGGEFYTPTSIVEGRTSMRFVYHDIGQRHKGEIVEVTLVGNAANVRLMDGSNLQKYRNGRSHRFIGGLAKRSPMPSDPTIWSLARCGGSHRHARKSSVICARTSGYASSISGGPPLVGSEFGDWPPGTDDMARNYDVFISHASEDVALVSSFYLAHLSLRDGLITNWMESSQRALTGEQILLPIWHNITKGEILEYSPSLADKVARSTATHTVEEIAKKVES